MYYKVVVFLANATGDLEDTLNDLRADGYRPLHFWNIDSRMICVFEQIPQKGRPKSAETSLGE